MNIEATIREIQRRTPLPPNRRAPHGGWIDPAWVTRGLVEKGWTVSGAIRQVIETLNLHPPDTAFKGIRAAYYVLKDQPWPVRREEVGS